MDARPARTFAWVLVVVGVVVAGAYAAVVYPKMAAPALASDTIHDRPRAEQEERRRQKEREDTAVGSARDAARQAEDPSTRSILQNQRRGAERDPTDRCRRLGDCPSTGDDVRDQLRRSRETGR